MLSFGGLQLEPQLIGALEIGQRETRYIQRTKGPTTGNSTMGQVNNLGMLLSLLEQLPLAILFLGFEKPLQFLHALLRLLRHALSPGQCLRSVTT